MMHDAATTAMVEGALEQNGFKSDVRSVFVFARRGALAILRRINAARLALWRVLMAVFFFSRGSIASWHILHDCLLWISFLLIGLFQLDVWKVDAFHQGPNCNSNNFTCRASLAVADT